MTVSSTTTKVSYSGDGSNAVFAYTFKIFDAAELTTISRVDATGAETVEALNTAYIVDGVENPNGGNVTFKYNTGNPSDPNYSVTDYRPQTGETVVIKRIVGLTQLTDYTPNDPFPANDHEEALDKLTFIAQQQQEQIDRGIKFDETDTFSGELPIASLRANKYLAFGANGDISLASGTTSTVVTTPFSDTLLDDTSASQARTTLGLGALSTLNTVDTAQIDDDAVTTAKIEDGAITEAKLGFSLASPTVAYFQGENGAIGAVGGKGDIFRVHQQQLDTDVTIAAGDNAGCFFSLVIATGVTLTLNGNLTIA